MRHDVTSCLLLSMQKLCEDEWRPARLESECIKGESMVFNFHTKKCSPFNTKYIGKSSLKMKLTACIFLLLRLKQIHVNSVLFSRNLHIVYKILAFALSISFGFTSVKKSKTKYYVLALVFIAHFIDNKLLCS